MIANYLKLEILKYLTIFLNTHFFLNKLQKTNYWGLSTAPDV